MIGSIIRGLRTARGMTLLQLARASGVAAPNISRIERGETDPRVSTVERLLTALDSRLSIAERSDPTPLAEVGRRAREGSRTLEKAGIDSPDPWRRIARKAERGEDVRAESERLEALER